jgi:hypothetical protein
MTQGSPLVTRDALGRYDPLHLRPSFRQLPITRQAIFNASYHDHNNTLLKCFSKKHLPVSSGHRQ